MTKIELWNQHKEKVYKEFKITKGSVSVIT